MLLEGTIDGIVTPADRREHGVRVIHAGELDLNTAQTPGMTRAAAIDRARAGAQKAWGRHGPHRTEREDRAAP